MKTAFGKLTGSAVMDKVAEYREVGRDAFLAQYAGGVTSRTTWLSVEGELFPAKAIFAAAHVPSVAPKSFNTSDTYRYSRELNFELVVIEKGRVKSTRSAIDDLDELSGSDVPTKQLYFGERFIRDAKVRAKVIERANGKCEHCGGEGFKKPDGGIYLETHHIISLAKQGPDSEKNVIALCANDHREAHFGADAEHLEVQFKSKLAELNSAKKRRITRSAD
ncbi:MAG: hypothetical protein B7Y43_18370 [Sphingomonas sp. 28-62-20]|uniref:HNH endonuclease n=1 Tax=Sphingomonas sp. 28-62-20 TaxID=1970433 RepID=UPI000BCBA54E|nr:MAG: hypothetical protein B7Y43_18370 [Sphingomonas sp. 28-62-20]